MNEKSLLYMYFYFLNSNGKINPQPPEDSELTKCSDSQLKIEGSDVFLIINQINNFVSKDLEIKLNTFKREFLNKDKKIQYLEKLNTLFSLKMFDINYNVLENNQYLLQLLDNPEPEFFINLIYYYINEFRVGMVKK